MDSNVSYDSWRRQYILYIEEIKDYRKKEKMRMRDKYFTENYFDEHLHT